MIKQTKRNVLTTAAGTLALAGLLVFANGAITNKAYAYNAAKDIKAQKAVTITPADTAINAGIEISKISDSDDMEAKRTPKDMTKEQAVSIAAKAVEEKFGISLNGTYATPIFCTLENTSGNYYFVSFADKDDMKAAEAITSKENAPSFDVYIAFVNAKTGEVVSAEKNPVATGDVSHG